MSTSTVRVSREWLALREPADAAARTLDFAERLERRPPASGRWVIHDLGCGTGAMGRWLAPFLSGPQHWVCHDRDPDLLEVVATDHPGLAADGAEVTVEVRHSDITQLSSGEFAGATLITASALIDMLSEEELTGLLGVCASAGCPMLLTLSVIGRVELTPPDPLDRRMAVAFNAHQRRRTERGRLLGPDAVTLAAEELSRLGTEVFVRPSPWRLGAAEAALAAEWLIGWVGAACEQDAELALGTNGYRPLRLAQAAAGRLAVTVGHADVLAMPQPADSGMSSVCSPRSAFVAR